MTIREAFAEGSKTIKETKDFSYFEFKDGKLIAACALGLLAFVTGYGPIDDTYPNSVPKLVQHLYKHFPGSDVNDIQAFTTHGHFYEKRNLIAQICSWEKKGKTFEEIGRLCEAMQGLEFKKAYA